MQRTKFLTHSLHPARAVLCWTLDDLVGILHGEMHDLPTPGKVCILGESHLAPQLVCHSLGNLLFFLGLNLDGHLFC